MGARQVLAALLAVVASLAACTGEGDGAGEPGAEVDDEPAATDEGTDDAADQAEGSGDAGEDPDGQPDDEAAQEAEEVELAFTEIATGLDTPWDVAFVEDRAYLTERDSGRVLELADDGSVSEVRRFDVDPTGEGGLLGLTSDQAGRLYVYFSSGGENRVERFEPGESPETVLDGIPHGANHNGGRIAFGADGLLYVATGDAGDAASAQDPDSLAGKILRVAADGEAPPDNPIEGSPVLSLGHRNVQGLGWDAEGRLWASEFGPDADDEINLIEPGGNYGWPEVTGEAGRDEFVDPKLVEQPPDASWSGLSVLVDGAIPQWEGDALAATLRGGRLWRLDLEGDEVAGTEELLVSEYGRLRHAAQAPDGSVWVLTNNTDGRGDPAPDDDRIIRIAPPD